jgi:hypothetical protein
MRKALIFGISGQTGSYLAETLLEKDYVVHGVIRRSSSFNTGRINHIFDRLNLHYGDMTDGVGLSNIFNKVQPDEVYNMAAQSHVKVSFECPEYTENVVALGATRLLEIIRQFKPDTKYYQASCYSADTRVLTDGGLKSYNEINEGDLVFTLNVSTGILEIKPIRKVIIQEYRGDMVRLKNRRIDSLVTPNHKMLVRVGSNIEYIDASELHNYTKYSGTSPLILPNAKWNGDSVLSINFDEYVNFKSMNHNTNKNLLHSMAAHDFLYLLGIYIGDGYTLRKRPATRVCSSKEFIREKDIKGQFISQSGKLKEKVTYDSNYVQLAIPETDDARPNVLRILNKYNIKYRVKKINIEFSSYSLARMFKQSGENVYEKHIPKWVLALSVDLLEHLFEGLIDSDGNRRKVVHVNHNYI